MKIIFKIVQWFFCACILLFGLGCLFFETVLGGLIMLASGLLICPIVTAKIPVFKMRRLVLIVISIIFFIIGMDLSFSDNPVSTETNGAQSVSAADETDKTDKKEEKEKEKQKEEEQREEQREKEEEKRKKEEEKKAEEEKRKEEKKKEEQKKEEEEKKESIAAEKTVDKEKFYKWMNKYISGDKKVRNYDLKKWRKYPEDMIFPLWKEFIYEKVKDYSLMTVGINGVEDAEILYSKIYENSGFISEISNKRQEVSKCISTNKDIEKKYSGIDFRTASNSYFVDDFYITQRLEKEYSESILGDLKKKYDDYTADGSYWVGYDVVNYYGTLRPGESCYVIKSNELNPFPQTGSYNISVYDTGTTTQLKDSKGFVFTASVYQMINVDDEFIDDSNAYSMNEFSAEELYQDLLAILEKK